MTRPKFGSATISDVRSRGQPVSSSSISRPGRALIELDRIYLLEQGEIVAEGTHEELLESSALYQEIYESQLGGAVLAGVDMAGIDMEGAS